MDHPARDADVLDLLDLEGLGRAVRGGGVVEEGGTQREPQGEQRDADAKAMRERVANAIGATPVRVDSLNVAAASLTALLAADPRDEEALAMRAMLHSDEGRRDDALADLRALSEVVPDAKILAAATAAQATNRRDTFIFTIPRLVPGRLVFPLRRTTR